MPLDLWNNLQEKVHDSQQAKKVLLGMVLYLGHAYENTLEDGTNPELEQIREYVRRKEYHTAIDRAESFYQRANPAGTKSLLDTVLELPDLL